jgi:predicted membrane channel-forming protein YqfA (hemolysin III family)
MVVPPPKHIRRTPGNHALLGQDIHDLLYDGCFDLPALKRLISYDVLPFSACKYLIHFLFTVWRDQVHIIFHRFDYAGIVTLTVGSFYPAVYYGFYCDTFSARIWLTILTIAGASAAYAVLSPTYSTPTYRRVRTYLFIALGLGGALPMIHAMMLEGYNHLQTLGVDWLGLSAVLYIGGALI